MDLTNKIFEGYIAKSIIVFINEIFVYSCTMEEHKLHLKIILGEIEREEVVCKVLKMLVWLGEVAILGAHYVGRGNLYGFV